MKPGIYEMTSKEYHAAPGVSSSQFKALIQSPMHYKYWLTTKREPTEEMLIGMAVHALFLEPQAFHEQFAIKPAADRRTKEGKEAYDKFLIELNGRTELSPIIMEQVNAVFVSLTEQARNKPTLNALFTGVKEKSFFWIDEMTGLLCKCRPDCLTNLGVITDLKVTYDASLDNYNAQIAKMGYYLQAAHYLEGIKQAVLQSSTPLNIKVPDKFVFVPIERKAPHGLSMIEIGPRSLALGRADRVLLLMKLKAATENESFKGYSDRIEQAEMPSWKFYNERKNNE